MAILIEKLQKKKKPKKAENCNKVNLKCYTYITKKYGKSWRRVYLNIEDTYKCTSTTSDESFKIDYKLNCYDNCLFYAFTS